MPEPDRSSFGEPQVWPGAIVDPGQSLVANDGQRLEFDNRLEDGMEFERRECVLEPCFRGRDIASIGEGKPLRYNSDMAFVLVPPDQPKLGGVRAVSCKQGSLEQSTQCSLAFLARHFA